MEWWQVYLFTRFDAINVIIVLFFIVSLVATIVSVGGAAISKIGSEDHLRRYGSNDTDYLAWNRWIGNWTKLAKKVVPVWILCTILLIVVPTQKEIAAIYLLPKLVNSDAAKELGNVPKSAARILNLKLESYINDLEAQTKEEIKQQTTVTPAEKK